MNSEPSPPAAPAQPSLNPAQQTAVLATGNVLVAAGAGTGKTSTLVQRCLRLLLDPQHPCSLENILMVTFTEAAAAEMRGRIRDELQKRLGAATAGSPEAELLEGHIALLDTARISTLHSFCLELIRHHFHELALDPQVLVLDERQTAPMTREVLDELLGDCYAGRNPLGGAARDLVQRYGRGSDTRIRELILALHRHAQSLADPARWLEERAAEFRQSTPAHWQLWLFESFLEWRTFWRPVIAPYAALSDNMEECAAALDPLPADLKAVAAALERIVAAFRAKWKRGTVGTVRDPNEEFFDDALFLHSQLEPATGPAQASPGLTALEQDWGWAAPPMLALLELSQEFTRRFSLRKRELGGIDFSDQEQMALELLRKPSIAAQWQRQFHHVFVDECQDINAAQDALITAISRSGPEASRFLVGDVKQSIYRFRLADPAIFRRYEDDWRADPALGQRIPLSGNFRSRESVLSAANSLFGLLMRRSVGGVDYDADARLVFGAGPKLAQLGIPGDAQPRVELHLIGPDPAPEDPAEAGEELNTARKEARLAALRLRQLREERYQIWDGRVARPVEWSDMVVLLRSARSKAESYAREFHALGVPLLASRAGFYDSIEVRDLLNLLAVLDNPLQDLPLLAVLRSPLSGFSPDELASVRVQSREKRFWEALRHLEREPLPEGTPADAPMATARAKAIEFLERCDRWREMLRHSSLSQCLEQVMAETAYEAMLLAGDRGAERVANAHSLLDLAREYDPYQRQGLFRFLQFVRSQLAAGLDQEPAPLPTANAVRLITVHKSKGLEFPVVVVAGLGSVFNEQDLRQDILLDPLLGVCPKVVSPDGEQRYPSLAHWMAKRHQRRELLGEEMRLLYVAFTRARDTLVLVGTSASKKDMPSWEPAPADAPVADAQVLGARRYLDWLLLWLSRVARPEHWTSLTEGASPLLRWRLYSGAEAAPAPAAEPPAPPAAPPDPEIEALAVAKVRERLAWRYLFPEATVEPAKTSVSALRKRAEAQDDVQEARYVFQSKVQGPRFAGPASARPLTAAEAGTAHHTFLQWVNLDRTGSLQDLKNEVLRLQEAGVLWPEEAAALKLDGILDFWIAGAGRQIRAHPECVHREMPFTARFSHAELAALGLCAPVPSLADEWEIVQGYIDLAVILPDEAWVLDFKTDRTDALGEAEKIEHYTPQLRLYAAVLEKVHGKPVTRRWLHFLSSGHSASV